MRLEELKKGLWGYKKEGVFQYITELEETCSRKLQDREAQAERAASAKTEMRGLTEEGKKEEEQNEETPAAGKEAAGQESERQPAQKQPEAAKKKRKGNRKRKPGKKLPVPSGQALTPEQKRAIAFLLREAVAYLKRILPHLKKADADYALGDPAWTGELTGVLSLCPGVYGPDVHLRPDFESDDIYFRGYAQWESRIYAIHLVLLLWRIYRNEDCRRLFDI